MAQPGSITGSIGVLAGEGWPVLLLGLESLHFALLQACAPAGLPRCVDRPHFPHDAPRPPGRPCPAPCPGKLVFDEALQAYNINSAIFKVGRNADAASPLTGAQGQ